MPITSKYVDEGEAVYEYETADKHTQRFLSHKRILVFQCVSVEHFVQSEELSDAMSVHKIFPNKCKCTENMILILRIPGINVCFWSKRC